MGVMKHIDISVKQSIENVIDCQDTRDQILAMVTEEVFGKDVMAYSELLQDMVSDYINGVIKELRESFGLPDDMLEDIDFDLDIDLLQGIVS